MFPSNRDILCEAFLVEAIKFAIWDFFPPNRHKSAKNKASKQPFPACSWPMMWFKDLYSIPVCYYLFLSTNLSLKCSGPGPSKAFSFFKKKKGLLLSEEIAKFLHSFTLSQQWNRTWLLTESSLEAWPHLQPNHSSFSSSFFCFFHFFFHISTWKLKDESSAWLHILSCAGDAWFLWSPSSSEPRGALLTFFNDYFSSVENLSQNDHDSAFTDRYIVQYTLRLFFRPHSMSTQTGFSFFFCGDFFFYLFLEEGNFHQLHQKTLELLKSWTLLQNLDSHQSPTWNCRGVRGGWKLKGKQQVLTCDAERTHTHTRAHFLSARRSHAHPEIGGLEGSGIWHKTK